MRLPVALVQRLRAQALEADRLVGGMHLRRVAAQVGQQAPAGGCVLAMCPGRWADAMPPSSSKVGRTSVAQAKEVAIDPSRMLPFSAGGRLRMKGTRMPPSPGEALISAKGVFDTSAQYGP